ncbi:MAG: hypothetical protein ABIJ56_14540 [Pseudomonadota bacterium]
MKNGNIATAAALGLLLLACTSCCGMGGHRENLDEERKGLIEKECTIAGYEVTTPIDVERFIEECKKTCADNASVYDMRNCARGEAKKAAAAPPSPLM